MELLSASAPGTNPSDESLPSHGCEVCNAGRTFVYGTNSDDGIVRCTECGAPQFYCDLGGQG